MPRPVCVWFRDDLRLADNPALAAANASGASVVAFYVLDEESDGIRRLGGASKWWLHHALASLRDDLQAAGADLLLFRGPARMVLERLRTALEPAAVFWNRRYDAAGVAVDSEVKADLKSAGVRAESFNAALLYEPWTVKTAAGQPMKVFTPFWKAARATGAPPSPLPAPRALPGLEVNRRSLGALALDDLRLLPTRPDWAGGLRATWTPSESGARERLRSFLNEGLRGYGAGRDRPDQDHTSRLSPYLRFGQVSPRQVWHAAEHAAAEGQAPGDDLAKFQAELGWREFSYHLLFHHPDLARRNFQPKFDAFPWRSDSAQARAWSRGLTGYPIVDAGLRQLWATGWMHNRVRMITASFLIKHLLLDWRIGEDWFWDTLVDADPASNAASWQWVAGSGADAAPYFRIFNPILQGERFDPEGAYVRRFVPELARVPAAFVHKPWAARADVLAQAGVTLGETYPAPIVDHEGARSRALEALREITPT
ncbi:deoxyribodipyrimidine photolyase [Alsobacter soli]|uniref:Deoxyribodipyrimidine photo-lyase n=1 Tax=Alsobacter soli TaxID=2109933 RepID=A0A2T1HVY8_9HYPH|nr:deoxyribodipyrimidine photo-lyase [Alsobacter soli]PSC05822.1 deoxyribodipyrimidine photolyase [Alsobacter soli]